MKKILLFLISTCIFIIKSHAQQTTFQLEFNYSASDDLAGAIQNSNGNFIVAGYANTSSNFFDIFISEVSPTGTIIQTKTITTNTTSEILKSIIQTSDGGYLLTGYVYQTPSNYDWLVIKLDDNLNCVFYNAYRTNGNDLANNCAEISPGHYLISGTVALGGSAKPSVVTIDTSGLVLQTGYLTTNQFASPEYNGHYLGSGEVGFTHLSNALSILDTLGNIIKDYPYSLGIYTTDVIKTSSGNYACISIDNYGSLTGSSLSINVINPTLTSIISGSRFKASNMDLLPTAILKDDVGNFIIAANAYDFNVGNYIPLVIKTDPAGTLIWCNRYKSGTPVSSKFNSIVKTSDGGYLLSGNIGPWNDQHMFLVKIDSSGSSGCNIFPYAITSQTATSPLSNTPHVPFASVPFNSLTHTTYTCINSTLTENLICTFTGLITTEKFTNLSIAPSFFTDGFKINYELNEELKLELFDISGSLILTKQVHSGDWIQADQLASGYYFVRATGKVSGEVLKAKILKM